MEINQESSSPKPLTKSFRKRQRKKLAAALEKDLLVSEINSQSNESVQIRGPKSETKREYLSKIGTPPTPQKTEIQHPNINVQDALKSTSRIISCETVENALPEKSEGKTSNPDKELLASQSKRRRNRKKTVLPCCRGHEVNIVSESQKIFDVPKCLGQNGSQKDCTVGLNKVDSSSLHTHGDLKNPVLDKNTQSVPANPAVKTDGTTNSKRWEEESVEKVQSLPQSRRRRNRKKAIVTEESDNTLFGNVESKKNQEIPVPKHSVSRLPFQGNRIPEKEGSILANSISLIDFDNQAIGNYLHLEKPTCTTNPVAAATGIGDKDLLDGASEKNSVVIEKFEPKEKTTLEISKKWDLDFVKKNTESHCHKEEVCTGDCEHKEKKVINCKLDLSSDTKSNLHHSEELKSKAGDLVDATKSPTERRFDFQKDKIQSSVVFEKTGVCCSHTSQTAVSPSSCPIAPAAGAALENIKSVKEIPVDTMSKNQGKKIDKPTARVPPVVDKKLEIKSDIVDAVVVAMDNVMLNENKEGPKADAPNIISSREDDKHKEQIKTEREARKAAKLAKKKKVPDVSKDISETAVGQAPAVSEALAGNKIGKVVVTKDGDVPAKPDVSSKEGDIGGKSKAELRAERRAKQEAQRAAKALSSSVALSQTKGKNVEENSSKTVLQESKKNEPNKGLVNVKAIRKEQGDKLLSRLGWNDGQVKKGSSDGTTLQETREIHPAIVQLSTRFTDRIISGSNARCLAFVQAIKAVIHDYQTPSQKELGRDLDSRLLTPSLAYLEAQRPHAVSVSNASRFLKWQLTQLQQSSSESTSVPYSETKKSTVITDKEAKESLFISLDGYVWEKIKVAEEAVCQTLKDKIRDGDVILTYGCSYLLQQVLMGAKRAGTKFKVIVVDGRPWREGREMLRCLVAVGIPCSYVLISAASSVMRQVNKVLLGAHALLSNGYVMSRVGVSQVALLANAHNVPVLVACETHKFCERVQSDSFVYNEMGEPDGLAQLLGGEDGPLSGWRSIPSLKLLNLSYDVTPPELVTAVATELAVLPCTSVPVVLRVRPTEPITSRH